MTRAVTRTFDTWWFLLAVGLAPLFCWLNQDALGMQGIYPYYVCFRHVIQAGLNPAADHCASPTFPMWGYGWLLTITESKYSLLLAQTLLAIAAAWLLLRSLERLQLLVGRPLRIAKAALVVSIPWYAFNALRWPYSEAVSLVLVSIALLLLGLGADRARYPLFALSGALFGAALNFRSDYVALPILIAVLTVALARRRRETVARMGVWLAAIVVLLVPWMVYSHRATHHFLLTSTNSGHVLFISLGQLPGNPWGITPSDGDPRMHRELDAHFHRRGVSSLTYPSDTFLRGRFLDLVRAEPVAWLRKDLRNAAHTVSDGMYDGEFTQQKSCGANCWLRYGWNRDGTARVRSRLSTMFGQGLNVGERLRFALFEASAVEGRLVSLVGFLLSALLLVFSLFRRNVALAVLAAVPVYQLLLNTFAYELPAYTSNVYVILIVASGVCLTNVSHLLSQRQGRRERADEMA